LDLRETPLKHLDTVVARGIVYDPNVNGAKTSVIKERVETVLEMLASVVVDDDDR
jgi:hypothetical protein